MKPITETKLIPVQQKTNPNSNNRPQRYVIKSRCMYNQNKAEISENSIFVQIRLQKFPMPMPTSMPMPMLIPEAMKFEADAQQPSFYCWKCKKMDTDLQCSKCIRRFHQECVKCVEHVKSNTGANWICDECSKGGEFA